MLLVQVPLSLTHFFFFLDLLILVLLSCRQSEHNTVNLFGTFCYYDQYSRDSRSCRMYVLHRRSQKFYKFTRKHLRLLPF